MAAAISLVNEENKFFLKSEKLFKNKRVAQIDVALCVVHGTNIEDGALAGYLEMVNIPYTSSNIVGSAIGQDKVFMKQILQANNLPVVEYVAFNRFD